MAAANCKVVCKVDYDYTSSEPITSSTAHYKIKDSSGSYIEYTKDPAPPNGNEVALEGIQSADQYELTLTLTVNGTTDQEVVNFQVDRCDLTSCKTPYIDEIYLGANDQIMMKYTVDSNNFYAVEYQIAKDDKFTDIVHFRLVMGNDYNPTERIEMNDGTLQQNTVYYIRARKHCSRSEVSVWSNVIRFTSGKWSGQKVLDVNCLATFDDLDKDICFGVNDYVWKTKVTLNTSVLNIGSLIYLTNGKLAIKENLQSLGSVVPDKFKNNGIQWIRFSSITPNMVYVVKPETAEIVDTVKDFDCSRS